MTTMSTVRTPRPSAAPRSLATGLNTAVAGLVLCCAHAAAQLATTEDSAAPPDPAAAAEPAAAAAEPADATAASLPPPVARFETDLQLEQLVEQERFAEALPVGASLVELTVAEFGATSVETARVYQQVADVQRRAGEHEIASESYLKSIEVYRAVDGPFSALVIEPMTGLGDNYQEAGDHLRAVSAYGEARTVSRRSFGLLNVRQIPLLDRMTVSLASMGQHVEADQQQLEALRLVERNSPPQSEQALAATYKYAEWLGDNGRFQEQRERYASALRTIREVYGKDAAQQVQPLVGIGNSFRRQRIPDGQGVSALRDALMLLLAQSDPDELAVAEVLRDLGDWEIAFNKVGYDGAEYRRAWQLLGNVANGDGLRRAWFTGTAYVLREPISERGLSEGEDALDGHVLVRFDLDALGRSANVVVMESDPPGFKDESLLRHVRRSRFRPHMVDGELVPAVGLALQFNYRYAPDETLGTNEEQD
jgi:tetratricopeptide (TPR) repeat protein